MFTNNNKDQSGGRREHVMLGFMAYNNHPVLGLCPQSQVVIDHTSKATISFHGLIN